MAIEAEALRLALNGRVVLDGVNLRVGTGEVCGVLGPNGAGKTSTIRVLNGLLRPDGGHSRVLGLDPAVAGDRVRALTGVLTEAPSLYERLTAYENLAFFGTLHGLGPGELPGCMATALERVGLSDRAHERAGGFSRGLKQRLAIARAILHDPPLLFLDEPTAGLDPASAAQVGALIADLRSRGRTVFLCTHLLNEAERLCDRFVLFDRGRVLAQGSRAELARLAARVPLARLEFEGQPPPLPDLRGVIACEVTGRYWHATLAGPEVLPDLVAAAVGAGGRVVRVESLEPTLDELYVGLMTAGGQRA